MLKKIEKESGILVLVVQFGQIYATHFIHTICTVWQMMYMPLVDMALPFVEYGDAAFLSLVGNGHALGRSSHAFSGLFIPLVELFSVHQCDMSVPPT